MSSARGRANHELYLARIVATAWQRSIDEQQIPATLLAQAFLPAARGHLLDAYGWFLLAVASPDQAPDVPPHCCDELPAPADGRSVPGEIREFRQLESSGWLAQLLAEPVLQPRVRSASANLALEAGQAADAGEVLGWADALQGLFERMGDLLDEC